MVIHFKILSNEEKDFLLEMTLDSNQSFFDLHFTIQSKLGYDKSQMASFYITNDKWEKEQKISLLDMRPHDKSDPMVMHKVKLSKLIHKKKQKLIYVYDIFSERFLFIEILNITPPEKNISYPHYKRFLGKIPRQILIEDNFIDPDIPDNLNDFEDDLKY
ncbi:MAG: hypothetical protein IIB05_00935 [Bacteroidetes bacterium]|nr:hypothetical protein [Bacteroidota bacterium]